MRAAERLLIVGPTWVGDAVMMQTLLRRIKAREPDVRLTVLAPGYLEGLLRRMPEVDGFVANPFGHGALRLAARWRFGRALRGQFDRAIVLPNSLKAALIPFFAGVPRRTGFVGEGRYGLLNDARRLDKAALPRMVDRFNLLAEPPGAAAPQAALLPSLAADPARSAAVARRLGLDLSRPAVALCVGAEYGPAKRWPAAHFADLAKLLGAAGFASWLVGSAKDGAVAAEIERLAPGASVNLCGATRLDEAVDLLGAAAAVVSNDSGLMHVASALDRPLVALYGSSSPVFTPPLSAAAVVLKRDVACSPCFKRECPLGHFDCMRSLTPRDVFDAVVKGTAAPAAVPIPPLPGHSPANG